MPVISRIGAAAARGFGLFGAIAAIKDAYFNYVTLLLPGNGTNGAQNNTFLDSSSNAFTITRNGNTTQGNFSPFSQTGWSNNFASGNYLSAASNAAFAPGTGDFTVEAWINHTSAYTTYNYILGVAATGGLVFYIVGGVLAVRAYNVSDQLTSTYSPPLNQWMHVAAVRSGTTLTIYANGTAVASTTNSYNFAQGGAVVGNDGTNAAPWYGYISNLRLVKGTAVYTGNFTPPTAPLTAITNTSLLTCQSNRFIDNSSNAFALTVTGSPSVQAFSPFAPTAAWSASTNGGSGYFDGSGDYLGSPSSAGFTFGTGDFTVEGWVYLLAAGDKGIFQQGTTLFPLSSSNSVALGINSTGTTWQIYAKNTNANSTATYTLNAWTHFALVRSGTTTTLYINGTSVITVTADSTNYTGTYMGVGSIYGTSTTTINAYIADFRVVKGTAVYTANFTPPTAPLTAITNTQLLLSATNGGIVDATAKNDLETVGNAQISTTQSKFGGSSMSFNGTNSNLLAPTSQNTVFNGDFTVEFWVYKNADKNYNVYFDNRATVASANGFSIASDSAGKFGLFTNNAFAILSANAYATATWFHIAAVRYGSTITLYVNGISVGTATNSTAFTDGRLGVGYSLPDAAQYANAYIDDLRVTKGIARYTSNFTPPTSAFLLQ